MDKTQFEEISDRLNKILKLLAIQAVKDQPEEQAKIALLDSLGFTPGDIDGLLGKKTGRASKVLYELKKKKQTKVTVPKTSSSEHEGIQGPTA